MTVFRPRIAILASYPVWLLEGSPVPAFGGHYATWLAALGEAFRSHEDFEVHWLTFNKGVHKPVHLERMGQHFHILPRLKQTLGQYSFYLYERLQTKAALKAIEPALVHAWGNENCYGYCGRDFRGKKLLSIQGALKACRDRGPFPPFLRRQCFYEKKACQAYRWITAESLWAADRVREICPDASPVMLEYAVEPIFHEMPRALSSTPSCLYVGSDTPLKNIDLLIRIFSRPELAHAQLKLAGVSPEERPHLPANIQALGRVSRGEIVRLMAETWCLVHPSLADTGPTVVKEARAMGIPVVLTEQCGSLQYVSQGESGYVVAAHDDEAFLKAVRHLTQSALTSLHMGDFGLDSCRLHLSEAYMYDKLKGIYNTILQS